MLRVFVKMNSLRKEYLDLLLRVKSGNVRDSLNP